MCRRMWPLSWRSCPQDVHAEGTQPSAFSHARLIIPAPLVVVPEATALQDVTRLTRKKLDVALDKRFFHKRYNANVSGAGVDYLLEMMASMNLFLLLVPFLPAVCSSAAEAERVRGVVKKNIIELMMEMTERIALDGRDHVAAAEGAAAEAQKSTKRGPTTL